jgi:hypothetical protein
MLLNLPAQIETWLRPEDFLPLYRLARRGLIGIPDIPEILSIQDV